MGFRAVRLGRPPHAGRVEAFERRRAADHLVALEAARRAAGSLSTAGHGPRLVVDVLVALSRAEEDVAHYAAAEAAADEAVSAAGRDPGLRARTLTRRAGALLADGRPGDARRWRPRRSTWPPGHPMDVQPTARRRGRLAEAARSYRRAIAILDATVERLQREPRPLGLGRTSGLEPAGPSGRRGK